MMHTVDGTTDKKVLAQVFKSFGFQNLNVEPLNETIFNEDGFLEQPTCIPWFGSVSEGFEIKELFETFGYDVDWNGDKARVMFISNKHRK